MEDASLTVLLLYGSILYNRSTNAHQKRSMEFRDRDIKLFWEDPDNNPPLRAPASMRKMLYRKLQMLDAAAHINDLRVPPGNRLEKLAGRRAGQYSIRVNKQWRLCFEWASNGAKGVELIDYY